MMDKYITIKPWETNDPNYLKLVTNDLVIISEEQPDKPEWENWIWCQNSNNAGWVPKHLIKIIDHKTGRALDDYSAKELSIGAGEVVVGFEEFCGWVWSKNENSLEKGWLPEVILLKLSK